MGDSPQYFKFVRWMLTSSLKKKGHMRDFVSNRDPFLFLKQKQTKWIQIYPIYDRENYLFNHIYKYLFIYAKVA